MMPPAWAMPMSAHIAERGVSLKGLLISGLDIDHMVFIAPPVYAHATGTILPRVTND